MAMILSVDGGGTKMNAVLLDEQMNQLGRGKSGGVNPTQLADEDINRHVEECLDQVFKSVKPKSLTVVYIVFVGDAEKVRRSLERREIEFERFVVISEPQGGLLAGAISESGLLALSGTGSDVFYISPTPGEYTMVGGRGPIAGDDGSGAWIGQQALRAVMRHCDGWGQKTMLTPLLKEAWNIGKDDWEIVHIIHASTAPYTLLGGLTRLVEKAAREGDEVALGIVREAGRLMGEQMCALIGKLDAVPKPFEITLCGGAWKTHPTMLATFLLRLHREYPTAVAHRPLFEHVCAGPVQYMLERGASRQEIKEVLEKKLPQYVIPSV